MHLEKLKQKSLFHSKECYNGERNIKALYSTTSSILANGRFPVIENQCSVQSITGRDMEGVINFSYLTILPHFSSQQMWIKTINASIWEQGQRNWYKYMEWKWCFVCVDVCESEWVWEREGGREWEMSYRLSLTNSIVAATARKR